MHPFNEAKPTSGQPSLQDLLSGYLTRQSSSPFAGLAGADLTGEVLPYESSPAQPVDARLAWEEAIQAFSHYGPDTFQVAEPPPNWAQLVAAHEPVVSVAFCAGNFPQLVRNFQPLLQTADTARLRPIVGRPAAVPGLLKWAADTGSRGRFPEILLAVGALRLAKQHDLATELITAHEAKVPGEWQAGWANEAAALAWQSGRCGEALASWRQQTNILPVLFNRGMAAIFLGNPAEARQPLTQAVAGLPDTSAWHHLGRIYLTLAESPR